MQALNGGPVDPLPDTSQREIPNSPRGWSLPAESRGESNNQPLPLPQPVPQPNEKQQEAVSDPLFFAIVQDQVRYGPTPPPHVDGPFSDKNAIWYPVAPDVSVAVPIPVANQTYAPVKQGPNARIDWQDIQGHVSIDYGPEIGFSLRGFDSKLVAKLEELSAAHPNRQMAIIFDNRIVAAPDIESVVSDGVHIEDGRLSQEETRFLAEALNGGMVDPLPAAHGDAHPPVDDLDHGR